MDLKVAYTIQLCLIDEVMYNVLGEKNSYEIVVKVRDIVYDKKSFRQVVSQEIII